MTAQRIRRVVLLSAGGGLIVVGVAMLFLPGPGLLTILTGLTLLATKVSWAQGWIKRARETAAAIVGGIRRLFQLCAKK